MTKEKDGPQFAPDSKEWSGPPSAPYAPARDERAMSTIDKIVERNAELWRFLQGGGVESLNKLFPPKVGDVFEHARVIDEKREPMRFRVTRIARGTIYYRPVDGGGCQCTDLADFHRYVKRFV